MFAAPPAPELKLSKALERHKLGEGEKVTYSAYRTKVVRVQCIECVWVTHEAHVMSLPIKGATVMRKDESGERLPLCAPHAQLWKKRDGVETDPAKLRRELVQVCAVAVAWIEAIDRRGATFVEVLQPREVEQP